MIDKSHSGEFPSSPPVRFELLVTIVSAAPQVGLVTVADLLPDGLEATAISGDGWSCSLAARACRRSDGLAPGDSFPPIELTVALLTSTTGTLINRAVVFSAGESNYLNNSAQDEIGVGSVLEIPTLSNAALLLFAAMLALASRRMLSRIG